MLKSRALGLDSIDFNGWLPKIIEAIIVGAIADEIRAYAKVLWKQYKPSLIELKGKAVFSLHFLALITGIESFGVFTLVWYSRRKNDYGMFVTLLVLLFAICADQSRKKPKTRFGSLLPIIKLA